MRVGRLPLERARGERGDRDEGGVTGVFNSGGRPRSGGVNRSYATRAEEVEVGRGAAAPPAGPAAPEEDVAEGDADEVAAEPVAAAVVGRIAAGTPESVAVAEGFANETLAGGATGSGR